MKIGAIISLRLPAAPGTTIVFRTLALLTVTLATAFPADLRQTEIKASTSPLVGLWGFEQVLGPLVRGQLTIDGRESEWRASISGFSVPVERSNSRIRFVLPGGAGEFRGRVNRPARRIDGNWFQPGGTVNASRYATPVHLSQVVASVWRGSIAPLDERISFYVSIQPSPNGTLAAVIVNPEFNIFRRRLYEVSLSGSGTTFTNQKRPKDHFSGSYDAATDQLTLSVLDSYPPLLFSRRQDSAPGFFSRTPPISTFKYKQPIEDNDGWSTASLAQAGIDEKPISALIEKLLTANPLDNPFDVDSLLIARHGKLVLEEYFHGFDEARPHDTRSASKTFASLLVGIARDQKFGIGPETEVYSFFPDEKPLVDRDKRRKGVTLKALMTMTSGFACDDNDDASPGNEDNMQSQTAQLDWYKYTLELPMIADPGGTHAVYCSADVNLVGGAVSRATKSSLSETFDRYVSAPLQFQTYHMNLMPTGEAYMGGGLYLRPRDNLKLGQVYLAGGTWNHHRVVTKDWVERSLRSYSAFDPQTDYDVPHEYGFGWHINRLRVGNRTFLAYSAGGNGGQIVMIIPELDLVVGFNGGSYGEFAKWYRWGLQLVPQYIIPAVHK